MSTDNKSLRELVSISSTIEDALIANSGELTPELEAALAVTDLQLPAKIDSYSGTIERLESVSEYYAKKAELFDRLSKASDSAIKKLKENLKFAMEELKVSELSGNDYRFKLQNSPAAVDIKDESKVPDAYKTIKTIVSVDKKRVLEDLKLGIPVEGVELKQGTYVKAYANNKARS